MHGVTIGTGRNLNAVLQKQERWYVTKMTICMSPLHTNL